MSEILEAGEVPEKLAGFKDSWYALAQKCEGLSEYKSGLSEGFRSALASTYHDLKDLDDSLDEICIATQMHVPNKRDAVEELRSRFMTSFRELEGDIDSKLKTLGRHNELTPRFEEISKNFQTLVERHDDLKKHSARICEQYSQMKKDYEQKISNIKAATDRDLEKIKNKFISEVSSMFEGYYIMSKARKEELTLDLLLERLIQDPAYYQKVDVAHKSRIGRKKSDIETRLVLLQYKAAEITEAISPILEEETRRIARYDGEEKRIEELGMQCRDTSDEEKALSSKRGSLEKDVNELQAELSSIEDIFENYSQLAELVDSYVRKFGETTSERNELTKLIESAFEEYEPIEKDVEKRELRTEVKTLQGDVTSLKTQRGKLKKDLGEANKLLIERESNIADLTKDLEEARLNVENLQENLSELTSEKEDLEKELKDTEQELKSRRKEIKDLLGEIDSLNASKSSLEEVVRGLEDDLEYTNEKLKDVRGDKKELNKSLADLSKKYRIVDSNYKDISSKFAISKAKANGLESKLSQTMKEKDTVEKHLAQREKELNKLDSQLEKTTQKLEDTKDKVSRYKSELSEAARKLGAESKDHKALKTKHDRLNLELSDVRSEVARLERDISRYGRKAAIVKEKPASKVSTKIPARKPYKKPTKAEEEEIVGKKISALRKKE